MQHQSQTENPARFAVWPPGDAPWGWDLGSGDGPAWVYHDFNCPWHHSLRRWVSRPVKVGELLVVVWEDGYVLAVVHKLEGDRVYWHPLVFGYDYGQHEDHEIPAHVRIPGVAAAEYDPEKDDLVEGECWWRPRGSPPGTPSIYDRDGKRRV